MAGVNRSKLVRIAVRNIGCIGNDGVEIELDNVVCLVGKNNAGKSTILRAYELAKGSAAFELAKDRCQYAPEDQPSEVLLEVHIPEGIGNVDLPCGPGDLHDVAHDQTGTPGGLGALQQLGPDGVVVLVQGGQLGRHARARVHPRCTASPQQGAVRPRARRRSAAARAASPSAS